MQQPLCVAIRGMLPDKVRFVINCLCFLFNAIYSKVIDPWQLDDLENETTIVLCQLEMYFPPSFFDIMVHLIAHVVKEIRLCGPVFLCWMYLVKRYMKVLKGYTKNQYWPEASIVERYATKELIEFCLLNLLAFHKLVMIEQGEVRLHKDTMLSLWVDRWSHKHICMYWITHKSFFHT